MKPLSSIGLIVLASLQATAEEPTNGLDQIPVKEVTIFKDGHSFLLHRGDLPVAADGTVTIDYLPTPVLGTFWPASLDKNADLRAVTASSHKVSTRKTAVNIRQLVEANVGAKVVISEQPPTANSAAAPLQYEATIVEVPKREALDTGPPTTPATGIIRYGTPILPNPSPIPSDLVMLETSVGVKALPISRILDITFVGERSHQVETQEQRHKLTLDLEWHDTQQQTANISMAYLEKGLKWTPSYRITLTDDNKALVKLQGTITNDMVDLNDVTANLVVGVPSFAFSDTIDPMALQNDIANLQFNNQAYTGQVFSNAIQSQVAGGYGGRATSPQPNAAVTGTGKTEDLFVFTVEHITLKKGERMVIPVAEYTLDYEDVFTLDIPFSPPPQILPSLNHQQRTELLRLLASPTVEHQIRLKNNGEHPLTTAPAMVIKDDQILAQGMMTYASVGGTSDISLTTAIDVHTKSASSETKRSPAAVRWNGDDYTRIDLEGSLTLTNYKSGKVTVEITRHVLGNLDEADHDGTVEKVNLFEDSSYLPTGTTPRWWHHYSWPWWWHHFNSVSKAKWTTTLDPGESIVHGYRWHYFWR